MNFTDKKILVIGDIILDEYIEGNVTRISPEAPIPILDEKKRYLKLGGAANVACNVKSLGANVWITGGIGSKDQAGKDIIRLLSEQKINVDLLFKQDEIHTIRKTRFLANQQQLLRVDLEDKDSMGNYPYCREIIDIDLDRHFKYFDAVIISDYNKGVIFPDLLKHISELNKNYKTILVADTHKSDPKLFSGFTAITPNKKEAEGLIGKSLNNIKDYIQAAKQLSEENYIDQIILTLSEQGMLLYDKNNISKMPLNTYHLETDFKELVDVTGAGDTVVAVYTLALSIGKTPFEAARLANKAAGITVSKLGTAYVTIEELFND